MSASASVADTPRGPLSRILDSSIGNKAVMALSGFVVIGWLCGHISGNLLIFQGRDAMNAYAHWLHSTPAVLWSARIGMLLAAILHIVTALRLKTENSAARPSRYRYNATVQTTLAGRTMFWGGVLIGLYALYHLLHFTWGVAIDEGHFRAAMTDAKGRMDVYSMVIHEFSHVPVAIVYILASALAALHISHGLSSAFQTLGLTSSRYRPLIQKVGPTVAVIMGLGFCAVPIGVLLGLATL